MIDTHSRFVYSEALENGTISNVMNALKKGMSFFNENNIKIKSIQIDNAMMFRNTDYIHEIEFIQYLKLNKIIKRLIPLKQPECNGCVERYHKTIDDNCLHLFIKAKTLEEISSINNKFANYYNFEAYYYYSELEHLKHDYI